MVSCKKCNKEYEDKYMHNHHIFPKEFGGTDEDGIIFLCTKGKKCHQKVHKNLTALKLVRKEAIIKYTQEWLTSQDGIDIEYKDEMPICPVCSYINQKLFIFKIRRDDVILRCSKCNHQELSREYLQYYLAKEKLNQRVDDSQKFLNFNKKIEELDNDSV